MAAKVLSIDAIVEDPALRGGRPILAGTTLRVSDLAAYHVFEGLSAEALALQFELDLAQVHAALSYYFTHRAEIDAEIRANADEAEHWRREIEASRPRVSVG